MDGFHGLTLSRCMESKTRICCPWKGHRSKTRPRASGDHRSTRNDVDCSITSIHRLPQWSTTTWSPASRSPDRLPPPGSRAPGAPNPPAARGRRLQDHAQIPVPAAGIRQTGTTESMNPCTADPPTATGIRTQDPGPRRTINTAANHTTHCITVPGPHHLPTRYHPCRKCERASTATLQQPRERPAPPQ